MMPKSLFREDQCFEILDLTPTHGEEKLPHESFYLIFRSRGDKKIGHLKTLEQAIALARKLAALDPGDEFAVMRAEVVLASSPQIEEIKL